MYVSDYIIIGIFHQMNFQFHINIYEKEISLAFNEMHYKKMSVDVSMLVVYWNENIHYQNYTDNRGS
jgi:hypothetical protein